MRIKYVLLDIDDTIFPSTEFSTLARRNAVRAMVEAGLGAGVEQAYGSLSKIVAQKGSNYDKHFNDLCLQFKCSQRSKVVAAGIAAYHNTKASILPYPEVPSTLLKLREAGLKIYAASNGHALKQWDKLIRMGVHNYFHGAFLSGEMGMEKSGKFFAAALKKIGASPQECVMVGDNPDSDMATASRAGITTVRIRQGKHKKLKSSADYTINSFKEILEIPGIISAGQK